MIGRLSRISFWLLCALAWAGVIAPAASGPADVITLKEEVYIKGPKVSLGEVADIQGANADDLAEVSIAAAALPGSLKRVNAALVASRLKSAGYDPTDIELKGARMVRARTLYLEISPEGLAEDLRDFIKTAMPWKPQNAIVSVDKPAHDIIVPDGDVQIVWLPNPQYRYVGPGTFRAEIHVDGAVEETVACRATVDAYQEIVVAARDIPRGKPLTLPSLKLEVHALSTLPHGGVFYDPEALLGTVAKTTIFQGQIITHRKVKPKTVVKRNQIVMVEAHIGALVVRNRAKAMQDGCVGDTLTCLNPASKQTFQGVVREDGVVVLE